MTKVIVGNSDTPLSYAVHMRGQFDDRVPRVNKGMVSHDGEAPPPKLNNAPVISGGTLAGGQIHHPSRLERLTTSNKGKAKSNLDLYHMARKMK